MRYFLLTLLLFVLLPPIAIAQEEIICAEPVPTQAPVAEHSIHATGEGIRVAVIDTGITPHEAFGFIHDGGDLITPDTPNALHDCDGHGTFVAGVITSHAPAVELISIRQSSGYINPTESGNLASLAEAIHLSLDAGAQVINISVVACVDPSIPVDTGVLHEAVSRAEHDNVVIVAASGNQTNECNETSVIYPTNADTVVGVAAREDDYTMAEYSLPGAEFSAPGTVLSAPSPAGHGWASATLTPQGEMVDIRGTSFAAPVVTATVALIRQRYPEMSAAEIREFLTSAAQPAGGFIDPVAVISHLPAEEVTAREAAITYAPSQASETVTKATGALAVLTAVFLLAVIVGVRFARSSATRYPRNKVTRRGIRYC